MALERLAGREQLGRASSSRPAAAAPATSPSAIAAALEPRPRSSGIRLTKRERVALGGREQRECAQCQVPAVARQLVHALALDLDASRRRLLDDTSFQSSSAAAAASKPGPRFAVEAGATARIVTTRLEHRLERRFDDRARALVDRVGVLEAVAGDDRRRRRPLARRFAERGERPPRDAGSQNAPSSRPRRPTQAQLVLGERHDLDPARVDERGDLARCAGSPILIADAHVVARSAAWPTTIRGARARLGEAARDRADVAAAAERQRDHVRRAAELLDDLDDDRLLSFDAIAG